MSRWTTTWECPSCAQRITVNIRITAAPICDHDHGQRRALKPCQMKPIEREETAA